MKKYFIFIVSLTMLLGAESLSKDEEMQKIQKIRSELGMTNLGADEIKLQKIRAELNLDSDNDSKVKKKSKILDLDNLDDFDLKDSINTAVDKIKESLDVDLNLDTDSIDIFDLEEGENWGMPSVFGFNKKKKNTLFGSTFLGDLKGNGSTIYKGFKHSGESAEFMSGVMYYNSKLYNGMFNIFDESPMNIFEDEDEVSIFDSIGVGNSFLDMFD